MNFKCHVIRESEGPHSCLHTRLALYAVPGSGPASQRGRGRGVEAQVRPQPST